MLDLALFRKYTQLKQELQKAKRERSKEVIEDSIKRKLARLKITRFFQKPRLSKTNLSRVLSNGSTKRMPAYQVSIKKKEKKTKEASLLDGICCFVTNQTEEKNGQFLFPPEKVINPGPDDLKIFQQPGFSRLLDRKKFQRSTMKN